VSLLGHQGPLTGPAATPQLTSPRRLVKPQRHHRDTVCGADRPNTPTSSAKQSGMMARSVPMALSIPAVGVSVALCTLGLNPIGGVPVLTHY
jgi:hypothetical protein